MESHSARCAVNIFLFPTCGKTEARKPDLDTRRQVLVLLLQETLEFMTQVRFTEEQQVPAAGHPVSAQQLFPLDTPIASHTSVCIALY